MKKYWWLVDLALLSGLAYLASDTALVWIQSRLTPLWRPTLTRPAASHSAASPEVSGNNVVILQRNLFAAEVQPPASSAAGSGQTAAPPLNLRLLGTVDVSGGGSRAILEDKTTKIQRLYRRGDRIGTAQLVEIERRQVVLVDGGRRETLSLADQIVTVPAPSGAAAAAGPEGSQMVQKVGENSWVVDRARVERSVGNVSRFLSTLRVLPYFERGKQAGYIISRIPPGSLLSQAGLANGDVIRKINGVEASSPQEAFKALQEIRGTNTVRVEVQRNRRLEVFTYQLK